MQKAEFLKSAIWSHDFPETNRPEIAMVGRSNAGKSSLLNAMIGPTKHAKVSSTPGKTRLLNFFNVGAHYTLVDLPGYGFAVGLENDKEVWNLMLSSYFQLRLPLTGIVLVCDVRREWTQDEQMILDLAVKRNVSVTCVLNKIDKLTKTEINKKLENWMKTSNQPKEFFHLVSTLKKVGVEEVEKFIFHEWVKLK